MTKDCRQGKILTWRDASSYLNKSALSHTVAPTSLNKSFSSAEHWSIFLNLDSLCCVCVSVCELHLVSTEVKVKVNHTLPGNSSAAPSRDPPHMTSPPSVWNPHLSRPHQTWSCNISASSLPPTTCRTYRHRYTSLQHMTKLHGNPSDTRLFRDYTRQNFLNELWRNRTLMWKKF